MSVPLPRTRLGRVAVAVAAVALVAAGVAVLAPRSDSAESGEPCREVDFDVELPELSKQPQRLVGELCTNDDPDAPVQILLHGGTYDRSYWDWPSRDHSYVDAAREAGFATLNLDRLGYGDSDRPDGGKLDFGIGGEAVHQVVEGLRDGATGHAFDTVLLNGHSMGGIVAREAAARGGVDAVLISGIAPDAGSGDGADDSDADDDGAEGDDDGGANPDAFYPAAKDEKFADAAWASGYLTTKPGARADAFLYPGTHDPEVVATEERLKDTVALGELKAVQSEEAPRREESEPDVPVAYVLGAHDVIACAGAECADSGADYVVPDSGHSINVGHGASDFYSWSFDWFVERR